MTEHSSHHSLPERGEFIVRGGYILTMDPEIGEIPDGDVHVKNGLILGVAKRIDAPNAEVLDARRMIVLPGMVDTHWHMWTTFLRSMCGHHPEQGYFPLTTRYGQAMQPVDMYRSTLLAAAEAIYSGITTVADNCHNVRSHEHAAEDVRALQDAGLRGIWYYGPYRGMPAERSLDLNDVEGFHRNWAPYANDGLLTLGMMWTGVPPENGYAGASKRAGMARKEFEMAREWGLPMCVHLASREDGPPGQVEAQKEYFGKDVLLIHMLGTSPREMKIVAAAGSPISVAPGSELRIGFGLTKACEFLEAGITVGVSVDTVPLTGNAHMFGILKLLRNAENAKAMDEFKLSGQRALEMGTIDGARALGMDHLIGSLTPGKRADLIAVSTDVVTMGVFTDPARMIVEAAEPANVDTVMVDGRILKRGGKLTGLSTSHVIAEACASLEEVTQRLRN
jgi:5-methylthioadenosine/S-adenosylhomocysteine deaminase